MSDIRKVKCTLSYDGSKYGGYQIQANSLTVQELVQAALQKVAKERIIIHASGRTDAGVHARGQVFHFQTSCQISAERWPFALNSLLPFDIAVLDAEVVPDTFHSRFDVAEKTYRYCLMNRKIRDVFYRDYAWHIPVLLNLEAMKEAAAYLIGEHDFTSFCSTRSVVEDKVRHVYEIDLEEEQEGKIWITVRGNGFLYNMVRIIVGTLVHVGLGKRDPDEINAILEAKDRKQAGVTAPAHGLFLWEVKY
jgi:tRNA pseudouridine38-40 synthase